MKFDVLTLFPDLFASLLKESILGRAVKGGIVDIKLVDIRSFARGPHRVTDDRPFGGGSGMVMKPGPICRALDALNQECSEGDSDKSTVILLTPQGKTFDQAQAWKLSNLKRIVLVCGRYEGVDERIRTGYVDMEISIGDYVLSGGELGAMVVIDAVSRLLPGVLGCKQSIQEDSFQGGVLEYPQYTRPPDYRGWSVPEILLSGDHARIAQWRREQAIIRTAGRRPELLDEAVLSSEERQLAEEHKKH